MAFLDAAGTVLVTVPFDARSVAGVRAAGRRAARYVELRDRAPEEPVAAAEFLQMQLEERQVPLAEAAARFASIRTRAAEQETPLPAARVATLDARILDLRILERLASTRGDGAASRDMEAYRAAGKDFLARLRNGPHPSPHVSRGYWYTMLEYAEHVGDADAYAFVLDAFADNLAISAPGATWVPPLLDRYRATLRELRAAAETETEAEAEAERKSAAAPAGRPPNVLFLAIDDLRPELGCYGEEAVRTPHIDALAAEGVTFLRHYVEVPTCGASRYALLTGRSARNSGARRGNAHFYQGATALDPQVLEGAQTFPELFRRSGYRTELIGKLSHTPDGRVYAYDGSGDGRPELPHAWDHFATPYGAWQRGWGSFFAYADGLHREDGGGHRDLMQFTAEHDEDLPDGQMAAAAERRLAALAAADEPFFLAVGFFKPHLPFVATRADWEAVQDWPVPPPQHEGLADSPYATGSGEFYGYTFPFEKTRPLDEASTRTARLAYLACVRYVDRQVGRALAALDAHGLAENTVVVLWSDHGWYLGEDGMWGKHTPLERAMHSPLIVRAPGVGVAGHRATALASSLDVYPTLVELCAPEFRRTAHPLDGVSLVPLLRGEDVVLHEAVEGWWGNVRTVRTESGRTFR